jgi:hypothetical protein
MLALSVVLVLQTLIAFSLFDGEQLRSIEASGSSGKLTRKRIVENKLDALYMETR